MTPAGPLLITRAEVDGRLADVRIEQAKVVAIGSGIGRPGDALIDAAGGALIPGLHDHHLHLRSLAAALSSVDVGPRSVVDPEQLGTALRSASQQRDGWIRATGYHESVAGDLDRRVLDALVPDRPVRVQHRSGALWMVNSAGADRLGLEQSDLEGIERDADGDVTGRLWRLDRWLHDRLGAEAADLAEAGKLLAGFGITGVTDATPDLDADSLVDVAAATTDGRLPVDVLCLGAPNGSERVGRLTAGPRKILLHDHDLPSLPELIDEIRSARSAGRAVAVHCVTRLSTVLTLTAIAEVGAIVGDRIEHGSVLPPDLVEMIASMGLRVVTQPGFVTDRGDDYLVDVDPNDRPHLYPYESLLAAGIPTAPSSDAPFGDPDPWKQIRSARDRRTRTGQVIGHGERVDAATVLAGSLSPLDDPGGPPRRILVGAEASLCLLALPLAEALADPRAEHVSLAISNGEVVSSR